MARRAAVFTQSDLDRAVKAAAKVGYVVRIAPGEIMLAPAGGAADNSPVGDAVDSDEGKNPWDVRLEQC